MTISVNDFQNDLLKCYKTMQDINESRTFGYRAPCFSLDRARLDIVRSCGFAYDASRIEFGNHPLYGSINMTGFDKLAESVFQDDTFFEFEATTLKILGKKYPDIWWGLSSAFSVPLMRQLLLSHISKNNIYIFYIHPFELSSRPTPVLPKNTPLLTKYRFSLGRKEVKNRIERLVEMFDSNDYQFTTFSVLRNELLGNQR